MAKAKLGGLGKGLDALFVDNDTKDSGNMMLRLSSIEPNKDQPRKQFDEDALMELADSIRQHGVFSRCWFARWKMVCTNWWQVSVDGAPAAWQV